MCADLEKNQPEKDIEKITLRFTDGTERHITKGFICGFTTDEIEGKIVSNMYMVNVSGAELKTVVLLVLELADKLNLFNETEDTADEES